MKKETLMKNVFEWGVLGAIVAAAFPELAFAQSFKDLSGTFMSEQLTYVPALMSGVAYVGGGVLAFSGALKLKAHAENPAQEKMAPGLARLITGGSLVALPYLLNVALGTTTLDKQGEAAFNSWSPGISQ